MIKEKIAEDMLAQTRSPQDAYEYATRREKMIEHNRTRKKTVRRPNNNYKTKADTLHKYTWQIQPTKQSEYTERSGWLPRPTVSAWNTRHKVTTPMERKPEQPKAMLQLRKSVKPQSSTIVPGKRQNLLKLR